MKRIFRAFLWMRWRVLVNSLERTGSRDTIERFSVAAGKLGPIVAMILLIPTSVILFILGITAGFGTATGSMTIPLQVLRYLTLLAMALTLLGPVILPTRDGGSVTRMLLLPIPKAALYMAQVAGALADPWIALLVPAVLGVAIGMAIGLSAVGTILALAAGVAFLLFVLGIASFASSLVHLLLRDRRRGDTVLLILVLVLPIMAIAPQFVMPERRSDGRRLTRTERQAQPPSRTERVALRLLPYARPSSTTAPRRTRRPPPRRSCRWRASRSRRWASRWRATPRTAACSTCRRVRGFAAPARSADCGIGSSPDCRPQPRPSRSISCVSRCARRAAARRSDRRC